MEFGKVPQDDLKLIDFSIPNDHQITREVLNGEKDLSFSAFVGGEKWRIKEWKGNVYPASAKESDFLTEYSKQFNSIELNATFYQNFQSSVIRKWYDDTGDDFVFCPKFPQSISHYSRLLRAEEKTDKFFIGISELKEKLGHLLLQLPDNFGPKNQERLLDYLKENHRTFPIAVELRNTGWFEKETAETVFKAFQEMGVSSVITDAAGRRDCMHMILPSPVAFIRFVANDLDPTDYIRLDNWAERINEWIDQGLKRVYFYVHNHNELHSPVLCEYFINKLNAKAGLNIPAPNFHGTQGDLFG